MQTRTSYNKYIKHIRSALMVNTRNTSLIVNTLTTTCVSRSTSYGVSLYRSSAEAAPSKALIRLTGKPREYVRWLCLPSDLGLERDGVKGIGELCKYESLEIWKSEGLILLYILCLVLVMITSTNAIHLALLLAKAINLSRSRILLKEWFMEYALVVSFGKL